MKQLIQIAFSKKQYLILLLISCFAGILFTVSGQLEMLSLGIITKKGPEFFELFAPKEGSKLQPKSQVTYNELITRFHELDKSNKGVVTKQDASSFMENNQSEDFVSTILQRLRSILPIDQSISALIIFLIFVACLKASTLFIYRYTSRVLSIYLSQDVRKSYFDHIQKLPMSFYHEHNVGALASRAVNDAHMIADSVNSMLVNYLQTPFLLISTLSLCFAINVQLSFLIFFCLPMLIIPIVFIARRIKKASRQLQKKQEDFASVLIEFLSGIQTIKIFGKEDFSSKKYDTLNEQMASLEKKSAQYDVSSRPVLHMIGLSGLIGALLYGLYYIYMPLHEVLFYCGLLSTAYEPIKKFAEENGRIQRGVAAAERLFQVLATKPTIYDEKEAKAVDTFTKELVCSNISFKYDKDWILHNFSLTIKKGEMVAIVGPTGSGKSTLAHLLCRLYDIQEGAITIDGIDIKKIKLSSLKRLLSYVPQKPFLFFASVRENITLGEEASDEELAHYAHLAHADEFIKKLPEKYNTLLQEAGKSLSGGQQQRLAITRALIRKSPILIMDEATSSLDTLSEKYIKETLHSLKGQTTQIIIAHRLSTIEDADRIIVVENGKKISEGSKEHLLATCPTFARMWQAAYEKHQNFI